MRADLEGLVAGHVAGEASTEDLRRLYHTALEQQDVFDALAEQEELSALLEDPAVRERLVDRLRSSAAHHHTAARWKPALWLGTLAAAAGLTLVLLHRPAEAPLSGGVPAPSRPAPRSLEPGPSAATKGATTRPLLRLVFAATLGDTGASLALSKSGDEPTFTVGETMRLGFKVRQPANVVLAEAAADGTMILLYPPATGLSARVGGGESILVPPQGRADRPVTGPAGLRRVRLAVFPEGVDPWSIVVDDAVALPANVRVLERRYQVVFPARTAADAESGESP